MSQSTAYIIASGIDYTYRFCGVTEIEYNFALNIDVDTSQGGDIINGARRLPNQIRLSVVETDVSSQPGWSASMFSALDSIRRNRVLCRVVTSMGSWDNMLLSEITATQDEENQYGWAGDIVFMQYIPRSEQYYSDQSGGGGGSGGGGSSTTSTRKTQNNSSTKKNTGTKAAASKVSSTTAAAVTGALATVLNRAGITGGTLYRS